MATLVSNPTTVTVTLPGTSALAILAATMPSNSWADFMIGSLTSSVVSASGPSVPSLLTYAARANWDPIHKRMQFAGTSHTGGVVISGAGGLITWDDTTNQVTRESYSWSSENPGHSYYHTTVNQSNGNMYFRSYNSASIYRRVFGQTGQSSWAAGVVANHPNPANQVAGGLEWFNELNGGAGGLVFIDCLSVNWSNAALTSWTAKTGFNSGNYQNWCTRAGGSVYFGGGSGSTAMYRLSSSGTVSSMPSTPLVAGPAEQGIVLAHPNGNDLLLFQSGTASGSIYRFNGSSWAGAGTHKINTSDFWVGCTIPEYGVILFLVHPTGSGTPSIRVYKA